MQTTATPPETISTPFRVSEAQARKLLTKRSFATLATTSPTGWPHAAGVLYELVDDSLYVNTLRSSRKARNITSNQRASVCVPVRRLPVGPPSSIMFQTSAEVLGYDDPGIRRMIDQDNLASLTSHGELDLADGCFIRIHLSRKIFTYGLGMSLSSLIRDPLGASGAVDFATQN